MTPAAWIGDELDRIGAADELAIAPRRRDGSLLRPVPIWVVRVGDDLYVRSWRGEGGAWYRTALRQRAGHIAAGGVEKDVAFIDVVDADDDAIDAAYRDKYARYPSYVPPMLGDQAQATTLKLVPRDDEDHA